jgi:hypothetical protein
MPPKGSESRGHAPGRHKPSVAPKVSPAPVQADGRSWWCAEDDATFTARLKQRQADLNQALVYEKAQSQE